MLPNIKNKRRVYLDYAATTPVSAEVVEAMRPFWQERFGNPSALYDLGHDAKKAVAEARAAIAARLHCLPDEIIFTPSGTSSDNLAILGAVRGSKSKSAHIITTTIEHHAVLRAVEYLEKSEGCEVTHLPVTPAGLVKLDELQAAIQPNTILVSIMYANNEIGTVQPIAEIGKFLKHLNKRRLEQKLPKILFHTDACQAAGALALNTQELGVDLLTLNGSKIYGPKGSGLLFVGRGVMLAPLIHGGGQEKGLVSGTENVPYIIGLAKALTLAQERREEEGARLIQLRDYFIQQILSRIPKSRLNGDPQKRLPNNINVTILDVEGEAMLLYLNEYGISCATGSACDSATLDPSHVILALGLPYEYAHGSLRFTLGRSTTKEDIDYVLMILLPVVETLRSISPVELAIDPMENKHAKIIQHGAFPTKQSSAAKKI